MYINHILSILFWTQFKNVCTWKIDNYNKSMLNIFTRLTWSFISLAQCLQCTSKQCFAPQPNPSYWSSLLLRQPPSHLSFLLKTFLVKSKTRLFWCCVCFSYQTVLVYCSQWLRVLYFAVLYVVLNTMSLCMYAYAPTIEFCTYRVMFLVLLQQLHHMVSFITSSKSLLFYLSGLAIYAHQLSGT